MDHVVSTDGDHAIQSIRSRNINVSITNPATNPLSFSSVSSSAVSISPALPSLFLLSCRISNNSIATVKRGRWTVLIPSLLVVVGALGGAQGFQCQRVVNNLGVAGFQSYYMETTPYSALASCSALTAAKKGGWGIADDWSQMSSYGDANSSGGLGISRSGNENSNALELAGVGSLTMDDLMGGDYAAKITTNENEHNDNRHEDRDERSTSNDADDELEDIISTIYDPNPDAAPLYDTIESFDQYTQTSDFADDAAREISLLVRCNAQPETMLIEQGRALLPLKDEDKFDVSQLIQIIDQDEGGSIEGDIVPTDFLISSVQSIFLTHARVVENRSNSNNKKNNDKNIAPPSKILALDKQGVASWMTRCLKEAVGKHDKRITAVVCKYGSFGTGYITAAEFLQIYLDACSMATAAYSRSRTMQHEKSLKKLRLKVPNVDSVWRDLVAHGIQSPAEELYDQEKREMEVMEQNVVLPSSDHEDDSMLDECEILDWAEPQPLKQPHATRIKNKKSNCAGSCSSNAVLSSHQNIALCKDGKTPKRMHAGQFVFIDEESCIGCTQCATIAPSAFKMLDNGRARAIEQNNSNDVKDAVAACPVSCMHNVAFSELKEMEIGRDKEDSEQRDGDIRRLRAHIPVHVARRQSDANHKSSFYHQIKHKCFISSSCPQKGCFDCPHYSSKGENPFYMENERNAIHVMAQEIIKSGNANIWRKTAAL